MCVLTQYTKSLEFERMITEADHDDNTTVLVMRIIIFKPKIPSVWNNIIDRMFCQIAPNISMVLPWLF